MDENHVIRIILEGKDKLSGVFNNVQKGFEDKTNAIRKDIKTLDTEIKNSNFFGGRVGQTQTGSFVNIAKLKQAQQEVGKFSRFVRVLRNDIQKNTPSNFVSSFREATAESKTLKQRINDALNLEREAVRARKVAVDEETRREQLNLNKQKTAQKDLIEARIELLKRAYEEENKGLKKNKDDSLDAIHEENQERIRAINKAEKEEKLANKAIFDVQNIPLTVQKKNAQSDEEALLRISREQARLKQQRLDNDTATTDKFREQKRDIAQLEEDQKNANRRVYDDAIQRNKDVFKDKSVQERRDLAIRLRDQQNRFSAARLEARHAITNPDPFAVQAAIAEERKLANEAHKNEALFQRLGRTFGLAFGDLERGISRGKRGMSELEKIAAKSDTAFARVGTVIGRLVAGINQIVNVRWFFLASAIQLVGTAVLNLGAGLVALASSAGAAAAAVGAGLVAAVSQALPVLGLLGAAVARVQQVFKAVQLFNQNKITSAAQAPNQQKTQREATERLADAQYALKQAYQGIQDAQYNLKQSGQALTDSLDRNRLAVLNLAQTRVDVSRDIVDSYFNERQAAISLKDAELGVVDAKKQLIEIEKEQKNNQSDLNAAQGAVREAEQRLEAAKKAKNQAGIAEARSQLAVAQQSLSAAQVQAQTTNVAVAQAQNSVKQARLSRDEARVEQKRVHEDSQKTQDQGLKGNPQFIAAQKELRDSVIAIKDARHQQKIAERELADSRHTLTIATRELNDAEKDKKTAQKGVIDGQRQLNALLGQLSPAERRLYNTILKLQDSYRKNFRPITDIIIGSFSRAIDKIIPLLSNPKITRAFTGLAHSIANGIDSLSTFLTSKKVTDDLITFIERATKNLPTIFNILKKILDTFLAIANVGAPVFEAFLGQPPKVEKATRIVDGVPKPGASGLSEQKKQATGLLGIVTRLDNFFNNKKSAGKFFDVTSANLHGWIELAKAVGRVIALLFKNSNKSGLGILSDLTDFFNKLGDDISKHPKRVQKFFEDTRKNLQIMGHLLVHDIIPALAKAFGGDKAIKFASFVTKIVIPGMTLFFQTLQNIASVLLYITGIPVVGQLIKIALQIAVAEKLLNKVFPATQQITNLLKYIAFGGLAAGIKKTFGEFKAFATLAKEEGIIASLGAQFPKLAAAMSLIPRAIKAIGLAFKAAFITSPWGIAILAIITAVVLLDRKFHFIAPTIKFIKKVAEEVFNWFKENWKKLPEIIIHPFVIAYNYIKGWVEDVIGFFESIIDWITKHWKTIVAVLVSIFVPGGLILVAVAKFHKQIISGFKAIVDGIVSFFTKLPGRIVSALSGVSNLILDLFKGLGKKILNEIVGSIPGAKKLLDLGGKAIDIATGLIPGGQSINLGSIVNKAAQKALADPTSDEAVRFADIFTNPTNPQNQKLLKALKPETLAALKAAIKPKKAPKGFKTGGIAPFGSDTVPAMLTPGEWILNAAHQSALASLFGTSKTGLQNYLFGAGTSNAVVGPQGPNPRAQVLGRRETFALTGTGGALSSKYRNYEGPGFRLTPHKDDQGQAVWFVEFADKTYGQVSVKDANKILATKGGYKPQYLQRVANTHGGLLPGRLKPNTAKLTPRFKLPVSVHGSANRTHFASGGVVTNTPAGGNTVHQKFEVHTEGETDWNYVMRLGAIHAQESY